MIPGLVGAAHGYHQNFGKATPQNGEKLEPRHLGHVEIRDDEFRIRVPELEKSIEAVLRGADAVTLRAQQQREPLANGRLVVHYQNSMVFFHCDHLWVDC